MSDFVEKILEEGRAEGRVKGRAEGRVEGRAETLLENIRTLMDSFKMTAEEVMNGLKIPPEKQKELTPLI